MILIILGVGLIGFIVGFLAMRSHRLKWLVGGSSLVIMVIAAGLIIGNDTWHWGMQKTTTTQRTKLRSSVTNPYVSLVLYAPVRHATSERVYVYRQTGAPKVQHTAARLITTNRVTKINGQTAYLINRQQKWTYRNAFWRDLFAWTGHHPHLIKETNTFALPTSWQVLSVTQAKWLAKQAQALNTAAKAATTKAVRSQVQAARAANPQMTNAEITALTKKLTAAATKQTTQEAQAALPQLLSRARQQSIYP